MAKMPIASNNTICIVEQPEKNAVLDHSGNGIAMPNCEKMTNYT